MIEFKENELYQEIEIFLNDKKVGEAEVDLKGKMLSRLNIFPPYQNKGYGTQIVKMLNEKYSCINLVRAFAKYPDRAALTDSFIESLKLLANTVESQMEEVK